MVRGEFTRNLLVDDSVSKHDQPVEAASCCAESVFAFLLLNLIFSFNFVSGCGRRRRRQHLAVLQRQTASESDP